MKCKLIHTSLSLKSNIVRFALLLLFFLCSSQLHAQNSTCINADFELGNFDGWEGEMGNVCCPTITYPTGIFNGRHTVMTGDETDTNTCDMVPVVAPGGIFSARLGNEQTGGQAEKLRYTISVTAATSLFIYKYAVVLQDPGHLPHEQPFFDVRIVDEDGNFIDPICGGYNVVAGSDLDGFESCGMVRYKNWTTVGLNLTPYIGQNISIEFTTGDCTKGGHFGYAYLDAYCSSLQINTAYCIGSSAAQLTAPIGFEYLWSNGETTQSITIQNAQQGDVYTCVLTSVTGCQVTVSAIIALDDPVAGFTLGNTCYDNAVFSNSSQTFSSHFSDFLWDFGDGTQSNAENPVHAFPAPGNYTVNFTISNVLGCFRTITKTVTVYQTPTATISYPLPVYCTYLNSPQPVSLSGTGNFTGGVFSSAPPGLFLNAATGDIIPGPSLPGVYTVTYTIPAFNGCTVLPEVASVKIVGSASATIQYSGTVFCQNASAVPQNVVLTGTGIYNNGTYSSVPAGLAINPSTGRIDIISSLPGNYTVNYTLISTNECPNFVASAPVTIFPSPAPTATLADGIICVDNTGQTISDHTFNTGLNAAMYDFQWFSGNNPITGAVGNSYTATQPGNYSVIITNPATGCVSESISATVSVVAVVDDIIISIEEEFQDTDVIIQVINGIGAYLYQLDTNPVQNSNVFYDVSSGMHTIKVTDPANCTNVTKDFFVLGYPKYFTPNADGINDYWKIDSNNLVRASISIYDRFGKLLHSMKDTDRGWDGTYQGNRVPATDYWFVVEYQYRNSNTGPKSFRAHFSLKR